MPAVRAVQGDCETVLVRPSSYCTSQFLTTDPSLDGGQKCKLFRAWSWYRGTVAANYRDIVLSTWLQVLVCIYMACKLGHHCACSCPSTWQCYIISRHNASRWWLQSATDILSKHFWQMKILTMFLSSKQYYFKQILGGHFNITTLSYLYSNSHNQD